jgi:pectate lyase
MPTFRIPSRLSAALSSASRHSAARSSAARSSAVRLSAASLSAAALAASMVVLGAASAQAIPAPVGRATLPANDGWAAATTGTTGGSAAAPEQVFTASTRSQLVAALGSTTNATPKIIFVRGTIDANVDDADQPLSCVDYQTNGYTLAGYLAAYDPAVWGRTAEPSGPLEDARVASQRKQAARVQIKVSPNTTIIGLGGARLLGANLLVDRVDNVILRNLTFENASDCFPQWDPTDTAVGNWNSEYDNVSLTGATHVWVDHNTFTDGGSPDSAAPVYFDRPFQQHDGELDITRASDLVTVEWNRFEQHGKTNLIGSSDTATADVGKLRVTMHHNAYLGVEERAPRVRFGQVDVYNNLYRVRAGANYVYSWGVGVQSQLVAEANHVLLDPGVPAAMVIHYWKGTAITERNNLVNFRRTNLLAAFNAANPETPLTGDVGWTPTLRTRVDPPAILPLTVAFLAGAH